jgi:uncharacterized membrane protein YgdD (TMEM256/DUF423 family)
MAGRILMALGCLFGAAGIVLMALAAHGKWPSIDYSATMTLCHAPVLIAIAVAVRLGLLRSFVALPAAFVLAAAVALFSADVTMHALTGTSLFPMAAPIGGTVSILAWLMLAVSALLARPQ